MKIGITTNFLHSIFSGGSPQTALAIGESLRLLGHDVVFIGVECGEKTWWEDCTSMKQSWTVVSSSEGLDLIIEIGTHLIKPADRKAGKHVWLPRKSPLLHDVEATLFPFARPERDLNGIAEVWVQEEMVTSDDIQYLELHTRKPVRRIPWIWTPSAVEIHRKEQQAPVWSQVAEMQQHHGLPYSIHICETHTSSASSCTVPLFVMREVKKSGCVTLHPIVKIHNAENVKASQFFRFNVLGHCLSDIQDISCNFFGRQRIADFVYDPKSVLISHSRFLSVRPYVLEALWIGIPTIHNSLLLKNLGGEASLGYYEDNDIIGAREAFKRLLQWKESNRGESALAALTELRKKILETFSPMQQVRSRSLEEACKSVCSGPAVVTVATPPAPSGVAANSAKPLRIGFCDMWELFNPEYNMFTLMVNATGVRECIGVGLESLQEGDEDVDLVVFGPFGNRWQTVKTTVPLVHYTGENTNPIVDPRVKLNLGFQHLDGADDSYLRLPLWMLEINWFGANVDRIQNPKPLPIDRCTKVYPAEFSTKSKFCAFVVTNPRQPMRNAAFQWLSNYKHVDSAGRLFNNVGEEIFAGLGGGGGELKKLEFLKNYKFCIAYENESSRGYTTEKYLHAKAAGCIPIYWGDPVIERDFDMEGAIDARSVQTASQLVKLVQDVDTNDALWLKKFSIPALDEVKRDLVRRTLAELSRRLLKLGGSSLEDLARVPRFLGATSDEEARGFNKIPSDLQTQSTLSTAITPINIQKLVCVTTVSQSHLPSLQLWLNSIKAQKAAAPEMKVLVYLMADVSKAAESDLNQTFPFAQTCRFPTETPEGFPDFWAPQHFAWKLWVYRDLVNSKELSGRPIFYLDAGAMLCRMPMEWFSFAASNGLSFLLDSRQDNLHWCSELCQKGMKATEEELCANQIVAGIVLFVAGHPLSVRVFEEAYRYAQIKDIITGDKFKGMAVDKRPCGHRHDQSILSILCKRMNVPTWPLDKIYEDMSLRLTYLHGKFIYVHRGRFNLQDKVAKGIDDLWVINLDRRADRLKKFKEMLAETTGQKHLGVECDLARRTLRMPAFDGKKLQLTPKIARLFKPHDFNWKKPVMGCALSHLAVWMQLLGDNPEINTFLICEDDARLAPDWKKRWEAAVDHLPADWDCVYLGGILPPNRGAFEAMAVEKVAPGIARIAENSVFGQQPPNRYFHWCAYAYVLSRRGAQKILEVLKSKDGYWTSADHMICNIWPVMNQYFLHPLPAGCYQDDDPVYQKSQFNDFSRTDTFDSDLWNNTERFTEEQVAAVLKEDDPLDILGALSDARRSQIEAAAAPAPVAPAPVAPAPVAPAPVAPAPVAPVAPAPVAPAPVAVAPPPVAVAPPPVAVAPPPAELPPLTKRRLVTVAGPPMDAANMYEFSWLKQILTENAGIGLQIERIPDRSVAPTDKPIVVLQRPYVDASIAVLEEWRRVGAEFYILHLSDEFGHDRVDMYGWKECLGVLRNYVRSDIQDSHKVRWIPLGWHWAIHNGEPGIHSPRPPFREYTWSFVGTRWAGREAKLQVLEGVDCPKKLLWMDEWNSPKQLTKDQMLEVLMNSWIVPCPGGQNFETFRIYEALEAGALPLFVSEPSATPFLNALSKWLPLLVADSWPKAAQTIHTLRAKPEVYEQVRAQTLIAWEKLKLYVKDSVKMIYAV